MGNSKTKKYSKINLVVMYSRTETMFGFADRNLIFYPLGFD